MASKKSKNNQATNSGAALAACEDLMLCILARLPVKSIFQFKSVCKSWNHLLSTQDFIKMQVKLSSESKNQSFLVHTVDWNVIRDYPFDYNLFVFNILDKKANILDYPFDYTRVGFGIGIGIRIVGCCNGLVCINHVQGFVLWNPTMNLSKTVLPLKDWYSKCYSLGFGYDAEGDDFKVVRILWLKNKRNFGICVSCVEVYSANSDTWTTIDPDFQFSKLKIYRIKNSATVNGNPYWVGKVGKNDVLVCFDMSKLVFKFVHLSSLDYNKEKQDIEFVDLNGSLGALVFTRENQWKKGKRIEYVGSWVFDDGEQIWTKSHSVRPIKGKLDQVLRCLKDRRFLGKRPNGQPVVFNSKTKRVKGLFNVGRNFEIYNYTASLAYVQGMEKVTL